MVVNEGCNADAEAADAGHSSVPHSSDAIELIINTNDHTLPQTDKQNNDSNSSRQLPGPQPLQFDSLINWKGKKKRKTVRQSNGNECPLFPSSTQLQNTVMTMTMTIVHLKRTRRGGRRLIGPLASKHLKSGRLIAGDLMSKTSDALLSELLR